MKRKQPKKLFQNSFKTAFVSVLFQFYFSCADNLSCGKQALQKQQVTCNCPTLRFTSWWVS